MTDRAVGITDVSPGIEVVAEFRARERTWHSVAAGEQVLVEQTERVDLSMQVYSIRNAVTATANTTATWRWFLRNPTGSGRTVAIRDLYVIAQQFTNALANVNAPLHTFERWTSTGTPSGGTAVTPGRILATQAPSAVMYSAPPTGLTNVRGAIAFQFFPTVNLTTTGSHNRAIEAVAQIYHTTDPSIELAPGEAMAFRQHENGTATEATSRYMLTNIVVEEFTRP